MYITRLTMNHETKVITKENLMFSSVAKWNELSSTMSERFHQVDVTDLVTAGRLRMTDESSFLVFVQGHREGVIVGRKFPFIFSPKLWISWRIVRSISIFDSPHTGRLKEHTHALLQLENNCTLRIPWHLGINQLVPEYVDLE